MSVGVLPLVSRGGRARFHIHGCLHWHDARRDSLIAFSVLTYLDIGGMTDKINLMRIGVSPSTSASCAVVR